MRLLVDRLLSLFASLCFLWVLFLLLYLRDDRVPFLVNLEHPLLVAHSFSDLVDCSVDHVDERLQRVLVERVDLRQVRKQEVNQGTARGCRSVQFGGLVNLRLSHLCDLHLYADLLGDLLRILKVLDQGDVIQDVSFCICQLEQQLVLQLLELYLEVILLRDQLQLLGSQIGPFPLHDKVQQLVPKSILGDCKVYQSSLSLYLRRVMRV